MPEKVSKALEQEEYIKNDVAKTLKDANSAFYLGRGLDYNLAMEGALKIKEISYIHAEAFAAGELKHGTIVSSILTVLPLQLLSYYVAVERGCDVDKPRNLAKSVTVE